MVQFVIHVLRLVYILTVCTSLPQHFVQLQSDYCLADMPIIESSTGAEATSILFHHNIYSAELNSACLAHNKSLIKICYTEEVKEREGGDPKKENKPFPVPQDHYCKIQIFSHDANLCFILNSKKTDFFLFKAARYMAVESLFPD